MPWIWKKSDVCSVESDVLLGKKSQIDKQPDQIFVEAGA